ncbi:hypothetical protein ACFVVX_20445 [Kitasatospora sp. NPDC058170]|uniref:hypothetical protein n=1 Tax=Kitasatospora sp. NPDC058170 TaxID=3346364 RepID=UPI0036DEAC31
MTIANLAKSVASQHRHEEAVALWNQFLDTTDGVASQRNSREVITLNSAMAVYSRRGIPGAADLAQRATEAATRFSSVRHRHSPW